MSTTTLSVQRECEYSQNYAVPGTDGDFFRVVHCWRKHSRIADWNIAKTVARIDGEINIELSEQQASTLPFVDGFTTVYSINNTTGRKSYLDDLFIKVSEGTAGSAYSSSDLLHVAIPITYSYEGAAQVDTMSGSYTATADGYITLIAGGAQSAPLGDSVDMEIYINGEATGESVILAPGDLDNDKTLHLEVTAGDVITVECTNIGDPGTCIANWATLSYQASI